MSEHPLVSFVIPCYNYGRYLGQCLKSIFAQEGNFPFEIIAVDDGSSDNTQEVLATFSDSRLRVITQKVNLGHALTITHALREARGEFIARIDPDDAYRPDFLLRTLEIFRKHSEVGLVYGRISIMDEHSNVIGARPHEKHKGGDYKGNELVSLMENNFICSATVIARRQAWLDCLPVPETLAFHDWYFTVLIARKYEFYFIDRVLADYRVHPANQHDQIVRDRSVEGSTFWLLDRVYSEKESGLGLECEKIKNKSRIYSSNYRALADRYFGWSMREDARRCYLRALRYSPLLLADFGITRRLLATYIGLNIYKRLKSLLGKKQ